ncbi:hypothetical protein ACMD2_07633 [Ananas comosus]|uniref:Uncharacterized protein n=1 Tax=Ananas comosus TaxID=4615 RepID=A0A199W8P3_ANACO|nr:hypothetical protein ACMD2_07633 [Ananas comosus]
MVKLVTARESRAYGPRGARNRWEYINAGVYVFASLLLLAGFAAQLPAAGPRSRSSEFGLVVALVALAIAAAASAHDLAAHAAGIDCRVGLVRFDLQLGLVEFAVPAVCFLGSVLSFVGVLLLLSQENRGYSYRLEKHALNALIAGPLLWLVGSILNACQVYERADGRTQILQSSVNLPFLMGSLLFLVGGFFNRHYVSGSPHPESEIMAKSWAWLCLFGSLLFFVGGLCNVLKVFEMQQADGLRLEKLRGGAQERLSRDREGRVPLNWEESRRRRPGEEARAVSVH